MTGFEFNIPRTLLRVLNLEGFEAETTQPKPYKNLRDVLGRPLVLPVILDNILLDSVMISVSARKQIVKTPVNGRNGTVKELIGTQDYTITIQGKLYDSTGYPEEQVEKLKTLFDKNDYIRIQSPLTDILEISTVVIESLDLPASPQVNVQEFSMRLISDDEFIAILEE